MRAMTSAGLNFDVNRGSELLCSNKRRVSGTSAYKTMSVDMSALEVYAVHTPAGFAQTSTMLKLNMIKFPLSGP